VYASRLIFALSVLVALLLSGCSSSKIDETSDWSADRIYNAARTELGKRKYKKAIEYYQKLDARYPYGPLAQQGKLDITYAYWKNSEPGLALAAADRFIREHPNHVNVDYAYYLKGRINFNEDLGPMAYVFKTDLAERDPVAAREAFDAFKILITRYPDSKYARDSRARMTYLVNALASHEAHVAEYYLQRGAYVAAVNRAQEILTTYPQTPAIERALAVMVAGYGEMGLEELQTSTQRTLSTNFPGSTVSVHGKKRAWWKVW
jgi:outer membrane protein assembly factor BamD